MNIADRINEINKLLNGFNNESIKPINESIKAEIEVLTIKLIGEDNEQTRGAIKALKKFIDMPIYLKSELEQLKMEIKDLQQ